MPLSRSTRSNIRAFVQWREQAVYAGEEIECIITFKNIATLPVGGQEHGDAHDVYPNGFPQHRRATALTTMPSSRLSNAPLSRSPSHTSTRGGPPALPGHRPALSVNVSRSTARGGLQSTPVTTFAPAGAARPVKGHGRSLSIISMGSAVPSETRAPPSNVAAKQPLRGHGRSASLQVMPKSKTHAMGDSGGVASPRQPSPLYESATMPMVAETMKQSLPVRMGRRPGTVSADSTPQLGSAPNAQKGPDSSGFNPAFSFPPKQTGSKRSSPQQDRPLPSRSPSVRHGNQPRPTSPRPPEGWSGTLSNLNPISRVMSSSIGETPRTSSEFYSMSNRSEETLTSEAAPNIQSNGRLLPKPAHSRQASRTRLSPNASQPETLMMAYVQAVGSFTLDGSLVNAAPFEEVKRKGIQSGGGVVGLERSKRSSGMFGAFSWSSLGESIGGLLGGDDMSSMAQMKATLNSKTVPLLSTPQSLLFVDLTLCPGETRSYHYRFALPKGLPPSHRGRAMKVVYHLTIGIQRPEGQVVKQVEVPFRVLGSYNSLGETLGHDLMSPYVFLYDTAHSSSIAPISPEQDLPTFPPKEAAYAVKTPQQGLEDFLRYTERLLSQPKDNTGALLSPTLSQQDRRLSRTDSLIDQHSAKTKEAIDLAILRSNMNQASSKENKSQTSSTNRFNIARSGQPVAVLTLLRPGYRLGESVIGTLDFTPPTPTQDLDSPTPQSTATYAVCIELESTERVDPSLALRSQASIARVTRRVHASSYQNTLFARQVSFNISVPESATPTFESTGVSLDWKLRVEFTVQPHQQAGPDSSDVEVDAGGVQSNDGDRGLLQEISRDDRGVTLVARERLLSESFEVAVPIRVFGVPGLEGLGKESEAIEV